MRDEEREAEWASQKDEGVEEATKRIDREINTLHDMILTLRTQLADTQNRVEELEVEALPDNQKPYKSNSGGWSAW